MNNQNQIQTIKPFQKLGDILLEEDPVELLKEYERLERKNMNLYTKLKTYRSNEPSHYKLRKEIAWNDYVITVIEEKMYDVACRNIQG